MANAKHHAYVFVKCGKGFPADLRKKTPTDPPLHYVAPTTGTYGAFVVLETKTREEADTYVATVIITGAGGTSPLTCHAQQTSPMMLKYKAQDDAETFSVVTPKAGQAQALFDRINDPKGSPLATHAGSAVVDVNGTALVVVGLGWDTAAGIGVDLTKLAKMPEFDKQDTMTRSGPPAAASSP